MADTTLRGAQPAADPVTPLGAQPVEGGVRFSLWSSTAERCWVSLFKGDEEQRVELGRDTDGVFSAMVPGAGPGTRYGFRADGQYRPEMGLWFDPSKLLTDPYALRLEAEYRYDARMAAPRRQQVDTAPMTPKALVTSLPAPLPWMGPVCRPGGLIYELNVRAFSMLHPDVPAEHRGTLAALRHPAVLDHLTRLRVSAVELMPVTAWIDERHLASLGLRNAWGYNPVCFMAPDPRLAPGGIGDLAETVAALRDAGIGVILDLVFNHTGESDVEGPTLSLRGIDNLAYYRHAPDAPGTLVNDTGTGNTLACDHPMVRRLVLDSLRHFVLHAGVDGFRFDLAPVLGRTDEGFDPHATLIQEMHHDPVLGDRILIAEPWDIGPGGYQLGRFPAPFLEWNDRYRDDVRRFWRGDPGTLGALATRLAGSSDVFPAGTRSVNFIAAHDGFTLADLVAYETKHNEANGEDNRDGHGENLSWNNGVEGPTDDAHVKADRRRDLKALLATLFFSRGAIMLTAGDEFGRSQDGNNNAYCQDNRIGWLDWEARDRELEAFVARLSDLRERHPAFREMSTLTGCAAGAEKFPDVEWLSQDGSPLAPSEWEEPARRVLGMILAQGAARLAVLVNGTREDVSFALPERPGWRWLDPEAGAVADATLTGRSCRLFEETEI